MSFRATLEVWQCQHYLKYIPSEDSDLKDISDAVLTVQGEHLPVNSGILSLQSRFFRKVVIDFKTDQNSTIGGKLAIPLDDSVSVEDATLMLAFMYGKRQKVETADEAKRMIILGDKYDIPNLIRLSATKMGEMRHSLYFVPQQQGLIYQSLNVVDWLVLADRIEGLDDLRADCMYTIMADAVEHSRPSTTLDTTNALTDLKRVLRSLSDRGVPASIIGDVVMALARLASGRHGSRNDMCREKWHQIFKELRISDSEVEGGSSGN